MDGNRIAQGVGGWVNCRRQIDTPKSRRDWRQAIAPEAVSMLPVQRPQLFGRHSGGNFSVRNVS